jgi:N6-adenosine-specific RNA methylase IME4
VSGFDLFSDVATIPAPASAGKFRTLMSDPPWLERGSGQCKRGADRHYPLMKTDEICALPVSSWMADDAHAYIWVTNNFLPDGLRVMAAWGFRFVTKIDWFKGEIPDADLVEEVARLRALAEDHNRGASIPNFGEQLMDVADRLEIARRAAAPDADADLQMGIGQYFRGVTESCLFGVRGSLPYRMRPDGKRAQGKTGFHAPRTEHSVKPESFRKTVELVSHAPYLEMFARRAAPGWATWGNEAPTENTHA